jgi:hypothetical protein
MRTEKFAQSFSPITCTPEKTLGRLFKEMRWIGQVAFIRKMRNACGLYLRRDHSIDLTVDAKIVLKWILEKQGNRIWTGSNWIGIGSNKCF